MNSHVFLAYFETYKLILLSWCFKKNMYFVEKHTGYGKKQVRNIYP